MAHKVLARTFAVLLFVGFAVAGCAFRSPILMITRESTANPKQLPLTVGVGLQASPDAAPTRVLTIQWLRFVPLYWYYAQFPKPIEMEYVQDCIVDYFRDRGVFRYVHPYPYDSKDVDLVVVARPRQVRCTHNASYSMGWNIAVAIPFVELLSPVRHFVLPEEEYRSSFALDFVVQTPDGRQVARYSFTEAHNQRVWIYAQPYANYLWYRSVFRRDFMAIMDNLRQQVERDSDKLLAAARKPAGTP